MSKLEIVSEGGRVEYEFWSTGAITDTEGLEDHEEIDEKHVHGHCNGATDTFGFNGTPMDFVVREGYADMTLYLDGEEVKPSHLKMDVVEVESVEGGLACYGISSSGHMVQPAATEANDHRVSDSEFEGAVVVGTDTYAYEGTLTGFWCNVDCYVTINGERHRVEGNPPAGARF